VQLAEVYHLLETGRLPDLQRVFDERIVAGRVRSNLDGLQLACAVPSESELWEGNEREVDLNTKALPGGAIGV
jgi:hypothetical protein